MAGFLKKFYWLLLQVFGSKSLPQPANSSNSANKRQKFRVKMTAVPTRSTTVFSVPTTLPTFLSSRFWTSSVQFQLFLKWNRVQLWIRSNLLISREWFHRIIWVFHENSFQIFQLTNETILPKLFRGSSFGDFSMNKWTELLWLLEFSKTKSGSNVFISK